MQRGARWARGQSEVPFLLTALFVGVVLLMVVLSVQRLRVVQTTGEAALKAGLVVATEDGSCGNEATTDQETFDPAAVEAAFVSGFYAVTKLSPEAVSSPDGAPIGAVTAAAAPQPLCAVTDGAPTQAATYNLTYAATYPYLKPFTVTLAVYQSSEVGQALVGDSTVVVQQPGVYGLLQGKVWYTLAGWKVETLALNTAVFIRAAKAPQGAGTPSG